MTESRNMSDEQQLLDRLIDGELSPEARRDLLQRLEQESGGWRRCALAFLESQSWGKDFSAWLHAPADRHGAPSGGDQATTAAPGQVTTPLGHQASRRRWLDRAGTLLAIAASFVIAFGLGVASRRLPDSHGRQGMVAQNGNAPGSDHVTRNAVTRNPAVATAIPATVAARDKNAPNSSVPTPAAPNELASALDAALAAAQDNATEDGGGDTSPIWLPSGLPGEESLLGDGPSPALPAYVQRALERSGHAIEQHQELWPVQLENGGHALVPIERVQVRYVGNSFE
jgi:hypothetical protein